MMHTLSFWFRSIHKSCWIWVLGCLIVPFLSHGQIRGINRVKPKVVAPKDSAKVAAPTEKDKDSTATPPRRVAKVGDIKSTVKYQAEDSMVFDVKNKCFYLYDKGKVNYSDINLDADRVQVNWATSIMYAEGAPDTTGKVKGTPLFVQGADKYQAQTIKYNFKSKKAIVSGIITQQGEGYLHGEHVKRNPDNTFYVDSAKYTTCNLDHPHFYIKSRKIKMIPGEKLISGPFNLYIADIPTPLGFLFGLFPVTNKQSAGIIIPSYGETRDRGFFLRDFGFYIPIKEYAGLKTTATIYSKGSFGFRNQTTYRKRYGFSGNLNLEFLRFLDGEDGLQRINDQFNFSWNHAPETKKPGKLTASVNVNSGQYQQRVSFNPAQIVSTSYNSTVTYSYTPQSKPYNFSVGTTYRQNIATGVGDLNLPSGTFSLNQFNPFQPKNAPPSNAFHKILASYTVEVQGAMSNAVPNAPSLQGNPRLADAYIRPNQLTFTPSNFPVFFRNMDLGARHSIPVSTTFNLLKYVNVSPNLSYTEFWYGKRYSYQRVNDSTVNVDTTRGFARAFNVSMGASANTRIFGTFFIRKGKLEAIRHTINPSIGYSFSPDLRDPGLGMFQAVNVRGRDQLYPRFPTSRIGGPSPSGRVSFLNFDLNNIVEAKIKQKAADTSENADPSARKTTYVKKPLLNSLRASASYNLQADSLKLSNIALSAQTIVNKFNFQINAVLDPYLTLPYQVDGRRVERRVNTYALSEGRIGRITSWDFTTSTSFNPKTGVSPRKQKPQDPIVNQMLYGSPFAPIDQQFYADFSVPWSLSLAFNYRWSRPTPLAGASVSSIVTFSGDISVTPKWKVSYTSGYDLRLKNFATTTLNITRDLHCWQMTMFVMPFGTFRQYNFTISAKASTLSDLKLQRQRNYRDRI